MFTVLHMLTFSYFVVIVDDNMQLFPCIADSCTGCTETVIPSPDLVNPAPALLLLMSNKSLQLLYQSWDDIPWQIIKRHNLLIRTCSTNPGRATSQGAIATAAAATVQAPIRSTTTFYVALAWLGTPRSTARVFPAKRCSGVSLGC